MIDGPSGPMKRVVPLTSNEITNVFRPTSIVKINSAQSMSKEVYRKSTLALIRDMKEGRYTENPIERKVHYNDCGTYIMYNRNRL